MRFLLLSLVMVCGFTPLVAQDAIYTNRGEIIACYVEDISSTEIVYKAADGPNEGAKIIVPLSEVRKIIFENGLEQSFENKAPQNAWEQPGRNGSPQPDKVVLSSGEVLEGEVVEKKRFGITFISKSMEGLPATYIPFSKIASIEWGEGGVDYINASDSTANKRNFDYLSPHFVSLASGVVFPIASFGETNYSGMPPGFATVGFQTMGEICYYMYRGLGFSAMGGFIWNPSNNQPYRDLIRNSFFNPSDTTASVQSLTEGLWQHQYLAGALGYYYESPRFMLDSRWIIGVLFSEYPVVEAEGFAEGTAFALRVTRESSPSLLIGAAITGRYFLTRKWQLRFGFQFMTSSRTFSAPIATKTFTNGVVQEMVVSGSGLSNESFGVVGFEFGAAFTLGK